MGLFMGYHSGVVICCFLVVLKHCSKAILLAFQLVKTISCKYCLDKARMTSLYENETAGELRSVGYKTERWNIVNYDGLSHLQPHSLSLTSPFLFLCSLLTPYFISSILTLCPFFSFLHSDLCGSK